MRPSPLLAAVALPLVIGLGACVQTGEDAAMQAASVASGFDPTGISGMALGVAEQARWEARERQAEEQSRQMQAQADRALAQARAACAADPKLDCSFLQDIDEEEGTRVARR
jgi:hypothetical protein